VATGTSGGLLDSNDHAQSIFKLEIIRQYMIPFISMLGSTAEDRRVVVLDGFAGRGRYPDGTAGSAGLILQAVSKLQESRAVTAFFVEKDPDNFRELDALVRSYAEQGLPVRALPGRVEEHLDTVLTAARGVPLFMLLDPCGALLPFEQLENVVRTARKGEKPQTEILLNFSADNTRRTAGQLVAGLEDEAGIQRMNVTCGGPWWRPVVLDALSRDSGGTYEPAAAALAAEYARRLAAAGSMRQVTVPVRRRVHHQPVYHLIFLTRSQYGLWVFADALGKARKRWLEAIGRIADDDELEGALFSRSDDMQWLIEGEAGRAVRVVEENILRAARQAGSFRLLDRTEEVFGAEYGIATESTVTTAVRNAERSGKLVVRQRGKRFRTWVVASALPDTRHLSRHLAPCPAVEKPTAFLRRPPAPLLEEERDLRSRAGVADLGHPGMIEWPVLRA
jgi:three-Cys-motif partner protein